jgi:cytochrome o ubiquinol oxidase operon protein cyoD
MKQPMQKTEFHSATVMPYVIGFLSAITLTLLAYFIVTMELLSGNMAAWVIMGLAAVQLMVQLVFFLHLGRDKKSRWNVASFYFMLIVLLIIVIGSLWIMENLNYNMMTPDQMNEHMLKESSKGF